MDDLDKLKQIIDNADSDTLVELLAKAALQLDVDHINTVQFVFWICYMAETDLNDVIREAWKLATEEADENLITATRAILQEGVKGEKELNPEDLEYFSDKIKIYESFYGKDNRTTLFWKLNNMRNDVSHNRIESLSYNNQDLRNIETRRQLLKDYFETALDEKDWTQSDFYKNLSPEEREAIEAKFQALKKKM